MDSPGALPGTVSIELSPTRAPVKGGHRRSTVRNARKLKVLELAETTGVVDIDRIITLMKRDARGNARQFWEALKTLATQAFGNTEGAFKAHSSPKDHLMSSEQFQEMCESFGFHLSPSILRQLFDSKLRADEYAMSMQDFQDALIATQIDRIRGALQTHTQSLLGCAGHIDNFIRNLALHSSEDNRRLAVARFQRKVSIEFCMDLWAALQMWVLRRPGNMSEDRTYISCATFLKVVGETASFQDYEMDFLSNIFDRVDRARRGEVIMSDLVVALTLISTGTSRYDKVRFLFTVFDLDGDGCLSSEQLLRMYCSLVIHGVIARGDQPSYDADILLGDELSLAKARRLYEYTVSHPGQALEDDLCTVEEWWSILKGNDRLLEDLVPGTHSIAWVLRPTARKQQAASSEAPKKAAAGGTVKRRPGDSWGLLQGSGTALQFQAADTQKQDSKERAKKSDGRRGKFQASGARGQQGGGVQERMLGMRPQPWSDTAEKFRVHTAIRFRHAVRGEWDAVTALNDGPPGTADGLHQASSPSTSSTRLPALRARGGDGDTAQDRNAKAALWADEVGSFSKRQKQGNWHDTHRETISDWSRSHLRKPKSRQGDEVAGHGSSKQGFRKLSQTQSLPNLHATRSQDISHGLDPYGMTAPRIADIEAMNAARLADVTAETHDAAQKLPTQRFGKHAMRRIRSVAQVHAEAEGEASPTNARG
eukprot:gb/GFBE01044426.1/.p1 GENE.gb/GFBE01044426.1/~~gb/GFBE01044426.1/.p1  ORF type:complete len:709 (+),score=83.66 gb/GFBE01044426.1/:1-2127(+)